MPPKISTSAASMKFDQKNWIPPNVMPQASRPGQTASVSRLLQSVRISQNGRTSVVSGRMRPIMALKSASGKPVTATSARTGFPKPP